MLKKKKKDTKMWKVLTDNESRVGALKTASGRGDMELDPYWKKRSL